MSYKDAVAHLDALGVDAMKSMAPSRHRIEALCEALDHPEQKVQSIHVAGTNGKTSTANIVTSLLAATGLQVATFTSPHLESVRERLSLNKEPITEDEFGELFDYILPFVQLVEKQIGESLTYFEILTGMFFTWASENANAAVLEVGLGGRWDATNVAPSSVAIITNVGLDHTELLGADTVTIAAEKVGVIKPDSVVVTGERVPDIVTVIEAEVERVGAHLSRLDRDLAVVESRIAVGGRFLSIRAGERTIEGLFLPLHGPHQGVNAALAVEALLRFLPALEIGDEVIADGLAGTHLLGRMETIPRGEKTPPIVLDVAHNPDGVSTLVGAIADGFAFERVCFVLGILKEKDHVGIVRELSRLNCRLVITEPATDRARSTEDIATVAAQFGVEHIVAKPVQRAVEVALETAEDSELVCVTGSHYVVGEARAKLALSPR